MTVTTQFGLEIAEYALDKRTPIFCDERSRPDLTATERGILNILAAIWQMRELVVLERQGIDVSRCSPAGREAAARYEADIRR